MKNFMHKPMILVVDDNKDLAWLVRAILKEKGIKADIANNAESAFEKIKKFHYAVILLDYKLQDLSGLQFLEKIRQQNPHIKVILMSSHRKPSVKQRANELQAYTFLEKPFDIHKLVKIVNRALKNSEVTKDD